MSATTGTAVVPPALSATYSSPANEHFTHTAALPALASTSPGDRAAYLAALRAACSEMQERVNRELTRRMDEDNARAAVEAGGKAAKVDDEKEEENYGEEVVEED